MTRIEAKAVGKRFNRSWLFRNVSYAFEAGLPYGILGRNGSGKSTLLKLLSGFGVPSEGDITFTHNGEVIQSPHQLINIAAPYTGLYEDMNLKECIAFHFQFNSLPPTLSLKELPELLELTPHINKPLRTFSSGMKQRVKLGLAILSNGPFLLLDEPTSNLDKEAVQWYRDLLSTWTSEKVVIICSNEQPEEYKFGGEIVRMEQYK